MFIENLDQFFAVTDFAITAVLWPGLATTKEIQVIFDEMTATVDTYQTTVEERQPRFACKTADIEGLKRGDKVRLQPQQGSPQWFEYTVETKHNDGAGTSTVMLAHPELAQI